MCLNLGQRTYDSGVDNIMEAFNMESLSDNPLIQYLTEKQREQGREEGLRESARLLARQRFPRMKNETLDQLAPLSQEQLQE